MDFVNRAVIGILLVVFFIGCGEQELASPELEAPATETQVRVLSPNWVKLEHAAALQTRSKMGADAALVFFEAVEKHGKANWQAIDAVARAYQETVDSEYRYFVDQILSREMLKTLDEVCPEGCLTARVYHVERLIESGNPDAAALEGYLKQFEGYWSAQQLTDARRQSAINAEIWLERQHGTAKKDCGSDPDCKVYVTAQEEATRHIAEAAQRLRAQ